MSAKRIPGEFCYIPTWDSTDLAKDQKIAKEEGYEVFLRRLCYVPQIMVTGLPRVFGATSAIYFNCSKKLLNLIDNGKKYHKGWDDI